jgi:putative ABC transport system permease protein
MSILMELREGLAISWDAVRANKLRSLLTTLGIVIGILTVTLMGTAIEGLNSAFMKSVSIIGADVLYVDKTSWFLDSHEEWVAMQKRPRITRPQVEHFIRQYSSAAAIAPASFTSEPVQFQKRRSDNVEIVGTTEDFIQTTGLDLEKGRFLSAAEAQGGRPVCVIGYDVATNLFEREEPLGNNVSIGGTGFEVIGVLARQGSGLDGSSIDNQAIISLEQFGQNLVNNPEYQIQVKVKSLAALDDSREELRSVFRRIRRLEPGDKDDFAINQQNQLLDMFHKIAGTIAAIGLFITGLSLFVGGIGIMNIMFVSVAERTREIGIRKAIGARRRTILVQFLMEAATICLAGGLLAIAIAWPCTLIMNNFFPATLSPVVVSLALAVAVATGLLSGFFPAWRAARMNPVDALRNE